MIWEAAQLLAKQSSTSACFETESRESALFPFGLLWPEFVGRSILASVTLRC